MNFLYDVGLPQHDGHQWQKHVSQKDFTYLITELVTLYGFLLLYCILLLLCIWIQSVNTVTFEGFAWLIRRVVDWMIGFIKNPCSLSLMSLSLMLRPTVAGPCQRSLSRVLVPWDLRPYFTLSELRLPFRRLLRLAGSRWRYSTPPPHGWLSLMNWTNSFITSGRTKYKSPCLTVPLLFCFSLFNRCRGNVLTEQLPSSGLFSSYSLLLARVLGEPLASNWLPLWIHYSGFQASCHNTIWRFLCTQIFSRVSLVPISSKWSKQIRDHSWVMVCASWVAPSVVLHGVLDTRIHGLWLLGRNYEAWKRTKRNSAACLYSWGQTERKYGVARGVLLK
jgi:hypothetical protein